MKIALYVARYKGETILTPPGLQYLAGFLVARAGIPETNILFADTVEQIIDFHPDILGVGSVSQCISNALEVASSVKEQLPDCLMVLGGYHISALPDLLPQVFSVGVIGEGERTFAELVTLRMEKNGPFTDEVLEDVLGICFRGSSGKIHINAVRPVIDEIDTLPKPLKRVAQQQEWPYLFTARGCPYSCKYCASQNFWKSYRYHSAEYVVEEIQSLVETFSISKIYIVDDLFIAPKERLRSIVALLEVKGLIGKLQFRGFVRVNLVDEEVISLLKKMGFLEIRFGLETASERLLKKYKDKPFSMEQVERLMKLCQENDLPLRASLMFGMPGETVEDILTTKKFFLQHKKMISPEGFYLMQPVPGTEIWEEFSALELIPENVDFSSFAIDIYNADFDWENALYLNDKIPLQVFKRLMEEFKRDVLLAKNTDHERFVGLAGYLKRLSIRVVRKVFRAARRLHHGKLKSVLVEVGCGGPPRDGYVGCDIRDETGVSVICSAWELSSHFEDVKKIYSRHMLEHLTIDQVELALSDWYNVLGENGEVEIVVPNVDYHIEQWSNAEWNEDSWSEKFSDARHSFAGFWGWQRENANKPSVKMKDRFWDVHKCGFNEASLAFFLKRAGFKEIQCHVVEKIHLVAIAKKC